MLSFVALGVVLATGLLLFRPAPQNLLDCGLFGLVGACAAFAAIPLFGLVRKVLGIRRDWGEPPTGPGVAIAIAWSFWFFLLSFQFTGLLIGLAVGVAKLLLGDSLPGAGLSAVLAAAVAFALFRLPPFLMVKILLSSSITTLFLPGCAALLALALPSLRSTAWLVFPLVALLGTFLICELIHWATARYVHCLSIKWITTQLMHSCTGLLLGVPAAFAWLAVGSQPDQPWNHIRLEELATLLGHSGTVDSLAFNAEGTILASGSGDKSIKLWDVATKEELATLKGHLDVVRSVAFSPDGKTLASASQDGTIKLWDVGSCKEKTTLPGHRDYVIAVKFSPDGQTLASANGDRTIKLWDPKSHQLKKILPGHTNIVWSVAFSPKGKVLASAGGDRTVKLWDADSGKEIKTLHGHTNAVRSVAFHPDNKTLASASWDKTIKLWDIETGEETKTLRGPELPWVSVSFSPNGKFVVASCGLIDQVEVWNVETGKRPAFADHRDSGPSATWTLAFSPDGAILATGNINTTIKFWDMTPLK